MDSNPQSNILLEEKINIRKYIFLFLNNWYWVVFCVLFALPIAYLVNRYSNTFYTASSTIIIEENQAQNDITSQLRYFRRLQNQTDLSNETAKLKSYRLAKRTISKLDFDIRYIGQGNIRERMLYRTAPFLVVPDTNFRQLYNTTFFITYVDHDRYKLLIDSEDDSNKDTLLYFGKEYRDSNFCFKIINKKTDWSYKKYGFVFPNIHQLVNSFRNNLETDANEKKTGTTISLTLQAEDPLQAVIYLNTLCNEYIAYDVERKNQIADNTITFIDNQIDILTDSLLKSERLMLAFKVDNNVFDLNQQAQLEFGRIKELDSKKVILTFKQKYLEYLQEYLLNKKDLLKVMVPTLADPADATLSPLISELSRLYLERDDYAFTAKKNNPGLEILDNKITDLLFRLNETVENTIKTNKVALKEVDQQLAKITGEVRYLPITQQGLLNFERKYDVNNKFYNFLLEKRAEAGIQRASNISDSRVLDEAIIENVGTIEVNRPLNYLIALILGIIFPLIIIVLLDLWNSMIISREDIEEHTKVPMLGTIGHNHSELDLPVFEKPKSIIAESFRHIRTNLDYILRDSDKKVILVTSTVSGEGKTFVSLNLGAILAMNNKKVLLLGMDLRRPRMQKTLGVSENKGVSTFLIGKDSIQDIIIKSKVENMDIIPAGPVPPNPAELLEVEKMKELISFARKNYDYVLLDTPPIALVTDALLVGKYCDASLYIIRHKYTHKDALELINNVFKEHRLPNLNLMVNDVRVVRALGYRYSYGYGYGYGYGYSYGYGYRKSYGYSEYYQQSDFKNSNLYFKIKSWIKSEE